MAYIKKLVMHGFKSFPKKTEVPFTEGINVVLGPNGSGKSNISDALCFVLGRLSVKSMRAAKARNLIFLGTKSVGPAKEASVEMIFDNSDNAFSIEEKEVSIKRIVRKNGQSIYKINNQTKTRQDILALLAQAGIDPNGFNIILQGEIQNFVRMYPEERRKIIEEVSGISIYESRKEKSLKELNKTEEKLKEVSAILRERTAYLNNLEKERQQALRFKKLEKDVKIYKKSILSFDLNEKKKELGKVDLEISSKEKEIEKVKKQNLDLKLEIENLESKISKIEKTIQDSTGLEQEKINQEIANLRADLAGLNVRLENQKNKQSNLSNQKKDTKESLEDLESIISEMEKSVKGSPKSKNLKDKEIELKKRELEYLEEQRKKFYMSKSELKSIKDRISDKRNVLQSYDSESEFLIRQMKSLHEELFDKEASEEKLTKLKFSLSQKKELLENLNKKEIELEKFASVSESEIDKEKVLIEKISKMDICPVCKNKITENHVHEINSETNSKIFQLEAKISSSDKQLSEIYAKRDLLKQEIERLSSEISKRESDLIKIKNIDEKKDQIKELNDKIQKAKKELSEMEKIKNNLEKSFEENTNIEQKYETARIEFEEISVRNDKDISSEVSFKQRELERLRISLKQILREEEDLNSDSKILEKKLNEKESLLKEKKKQEEELSKKFKKLFSEKDILQRKIRDKESESSNKRNSIYNFEQTINNLKIDKARIGATLENLKAEISEFNSDVPIIKSRKDILSQKLSSVQESLNKIGSINLRSLEVYDSVKKEYDSIQEKSETITKEKEGILKIIHEIDIKKKKAFLNTLKEVNEIFSRNFAQISTKGHVSLELENRKDPFASGSGVQIIVKTGHGKYFDVKSLSGGEQTMVALSLIFAIQELKPYCFYILDEIDAALDKRNSERLAGLLRKYMQKGQYVVITHNDEVISNATNIYGVSMHDGISKIVSLKV